MRMLCEILCQGYKYISCRMENQQNQQNAIQEFMNSIGHMESTPPDKFDEVLQATRTFYSQVTDPQTLGFIFFQMSKHIMGFKAVGPHIQGFLEQSIKDIITNIVESRFSVGIDALKVILDTNNEYYRHNSLDPSLRFPLGHRRPLNWYLPEVGQAVDVVKPYITSTSFCSWTRGILLSKDNKKYTVKYDNTEATATYKDLPFFDKLGQRTKDYDWRMSLEVGSTLDAINRVWYPSTVVETGVDNGSKRVRVTFRRFTEQGQKVDSLGQRYDGLGPNEDDWIDVLSCRIQKPGTMAKELCYYSQISEQPLVDDTYDLVFQKQYEQAPFWGIMRCTFTRSTSYLNFFQHFCELGGYRVFLQLMETEDAPVDTVVTLMMIFGYTSTIVPRMGLKRWLPECLEKSIKYLRANFKQFNSWRLDYFYHFVNNVGNRLFSLSRKHQLLNELRQFLALEYLKLNLEKNLFALKFLSELIRPLRPYQNDQERQELNRYLVDNQIFYKVIQSSIHEQVLSRSVELIKYMMDEHLIGWNEIEHIWKVIPHTDLRGRTTIEKLLADVSKSFQPQHTEKLIDLILVIKETDLTVDKLGLLRTLKDRQISDDYKEKILFFLWELLTVKSTAIKQSVEEEIESVYRGFITTIRHNVLRLKVVQAMLKRIREISSVKNELVLFREFILTYPKKLDQVAIEEETNSPQTIKEVIVYLKQENIYDIVIRLLGSAKIRDRIETTLEFLQFLFDYDADDISLIVKLAYNILGPSDVFLLWAKHLTYRALNFFIEMYQNTSNMEKFQKIATAGLDSIKAILLDINFYKGNIKILKKRKNVAQVQGPVAPDGQGPSTTIGTTTSDYSSSLGQKEEMLTFIYVLKSPFQCIGLDFLLKLLQYISSNMVYNDVIKLIIQFIVNLDDKIIHKAQQFMEEFLKRIVESIAKLSQQTEFTNNVKLQLETYVNLLQELFAETQKNGLVTMMPHFSTIEGETLKLKIENQIVNSDIHKKEPYIIEVNENDTLWRLKVLLSEVYKVPANKLDVIKYVNPIEDTNQGKSISQLYFFNEEAIKISKKEPKDIPRFELLGEDNETMTDRFQQIVEGWFNKYKNDKELMGIDELMKLGAEQWRGSVIKEKDKMLNIITKHDKDNKEALRLQEFKDYFVKTAYENNPLVWRLLNLSGYKNNLKHVDDPENEVPLSSYPRKILSHTFVYNTIFSILSSEVFQPLHLSFYKLLGMLETDQHLCSEIKGNIKDFFQNEKCMYRLSYGLETLLTELQSNNTLFGEFYEHGGHMQIAKKLNLLFQKDESVYKFEQFLKIVVIPNLLRILSLYVYPVLSENKLIRFLKKIKINHYDTPEIIKKIEKEENYAEDQQERREIIRTKTLHLNFPEMYALTHKILDNLVTHYDKEFLVKMTNEVTKLYGYLAVANPAFQPEQLFKGCNTDSLNLRRTCHALIYIYLLQHPDQDFLLLEKLIQNAPQEIKSASNTYFDLVSLVLQKTIDLEGESEKSQQFFSKLSLYLVQAFFNSPNQNRGTILPNKTIFGVLNSLLIILQKKPKIGAMLSKYKEEFIRKGLFAYDIREKIEKLKVDPELLLSESQIQHFEDYVKCKSEECRKILMEIVFYLYKYSEEKEGFFEQFILPVFSELGDTSKKNSLKVMHVGLTNYGSTCYLNSMLQVLNSLDIFRNAIMLSDMGEDETPLIRELKALFSFLFFSERIDYGPKSLLSSFVPPINVGIQQDTTEFLNFLFDQVEDSLKRTPYKNILPELFQGNQVAQMICHNCGAKRERIQQFFTYSVEIQGKYDLHSALEGSHAGELISDCLCETCQTRSDTTKRNVLNKVPNIFFVHLKRIVFNYDVFMNTKIHTRLYFPDELNFEPYTKEGLELREQLGVEYMKALNDNEEEKKKFEEQALHGHPKEYYQLKLKGIIVHSGTPDVGHYYTILKKNKNWVKFDDSRVTTFAQMQFEEECYGGNWIADEWGGPGSSKNAYVLVYEKEMKNDIQLQMRKEGEIEKKVVPYQQFCKTYNTEQWYKEVWLDNHSLMLEQQIISQNYNKEFLSFLCKMLELVSSDSTIDLISEVFFKVSALSGEVGTLPEIFEKNLHLIRVQMFNKYILLDPKRAFNILFHQQSKVREFASLYFQRIMIHAYTQGTQEDKNQVMKYIQEQLNILHFDAAKNWLRIDGYFRMFQRLVETSIRVPECYQIYRFFVGADILTFFLDFVLQKNSPLNFIQKKYSLGTKSNPVNFFAGLGMVATLVKHSFNFTGNNYEIQHIDPKYLFHLSDNAIVCLSCMHFYERMIKENQNARAVAFLIERLSIHNLGFSDAIARVLLKIINQNTEASDQMDTVLFCVNRFLSITDPFWIKRAEYVLGTPTPFIYQKNILSSLDEEKYVFPSTLEDIFPLQSLFNYAHINRLRAPLTVLNILKNILQITSLNQYTMNFILKMPSPSYYYLRYVDWVRPFVNEVANHLNLTEKKKEEVAVKISLCNMYLDDLEKKKGEMFVMMIGEIGEKKLINTIVSQCRDVEVNIYTVPVYFIESLPTGQGNSTFDKYLTNGRLETIVTEDSNILRFFKQQTKPLAIKNKAVQQAEDKVLIGLFDENPYPATTTATQSQPKAENKDTAMEIETCPAVPVVVQEEKKEAEKKEEAVQEEKKEEPQEEVVKQVMNVENIRLSEDYLQMVQFVNKAENGKLAFLSIKNNEGANHTLPTAIKCLVSKTTEEFYFTKFQPYKPWGQFEFNLFVMDHVVIEKPFYRTYHPPPVVPYAQEHGQNESESSSNLFNQGNSNEMEIEEKKQSQEKGGIEAEEGGDGFKNCPICTYLNPVSNVSCEVCESPLQ